MFENQIVEYSGIRVVTTKQIATAYKTDSKQVSQGFNRNKGKFVEGKHYFVLRGKELKSFLQSALSRLQISNKTRTLYLWTDRGALLMAKIIDTDTAWEAYERLVDFYFRAKEAIPAVTTLGVQSPVPPVELSEWEKKIIAYNRGIVLGVYRAEMERKGIDALAIYNELSGQGKATVASLLFGEEKV